MLCKAVLAARQPLPQLFVCTRCITFLVSSLILCTLSLTMFERPMDEEEARAVQRYGAQGYVAASSDFVFFYFGPRSGLGDGVVGRIRGLGSSGVDDVGFRFNGGEGCQVLRSRGCSAAPLHEVEPGGQGRYHCIPPSRRPGRRLLQGLGIKRI